MRFLAQIFLVFFVLLNVCFAQQKKKKIADLKRQADSTYAVMLSENNLYKKNIAALQKDIAVNNDRIALLSTILSANRQQLENDSAILKNKTIELSQLKLKIKQKENLLLKIQFNKASSLGLPKKYDKIKLSLNPNDTTSEENTFDVNADLKKIVSKIYKGATIELDTLSSKDEEKDFAYPSTTNTIIIKIIKKKYQNIEFLLIFTVTSKSQENYREVPKIGMIELVRVNNNPKWELNLFNDNFSEEFSAYSNFFQYPEIEILDIWDANYLVSLTFSHESPWPRSAGYTLQSLYFRGKSVFNYYLYYSRMEIIGELTDSDYEEGEIKINIFQKQLEHYYKGRTYFDPYKGKYTKELRKYNKIKVFNLGLNNKNEPEFLINENNK